jgi:cytochrome c556
VAQLAGAVQAATPGFVVEVKSGDKARIAAAAAAMNKVCDACHNEFRKEE